MSQVRQARYEEWAFLMGEQANPATPATVFRQLPIFSSSIGETQGINDDREAGGGRAPQKPSRGFSAIGGDAVVPVKPVSFGFWLKGLLGAPVTTADTPGIGFHTHVFKNNKDTLPDWTTEDGFSRPGVYQRHEAIGVNSMQINVARAENKQRASFGVLGLRAQDPAATSIDAMPEVITESEFRAFDGVIKKDAVDFAAVTSIDVTFSNGIEIDQEEPSGSRFADFWEPGAESISGTLRARIEDMAILDLIRNETAFALELSWTISANELLTINFPKVEIGRNPLQKQGPGGISLEAPLIGYKDGNDEAIVATLINNRANYDAT